MALLPPWAHPLNNFHRRTATRIAAVSLFLAAIASPLTWFIAREQAEEETIAMAMEESSRLLHHFNATQLDSADAKTHAIEAARVLAGGLFDIAEIYDSNGTRLAESMTEEGAALESQLPKHVSPNYRKASYDSLEISDSHQWVLRTFIPLFSKDSTGNDHISGYFEGVRIVSDWQQERIFGSALAAALMAGLASVLCGAVLYPVVLRLSKENERKAREVLESHISIIEALGRAIAKRDSDTGAHNYRVAWIATRIAEKLGLQGQTMQSLIVGSFLHDVGKIGIPDAILLKPGKLDSDELRIMQEHVVQGEDIVTGIGWLEGACAVVGGHHEKWNGTGYPRQLAGENIPIAARVFAVADVFDALCSKRPYKEPMSFEATMSILENDSGTHFDPTVISTFRPIARRIYDRLSECNEEETQTLLNERVRHHFGI